MAGDEPVMDALVESWFPNRLEALGLALDPRKHVVPESVYVVSMSNNMRPPSRAAPFEPVRPG